ncbi:MAG: hypothetical protein C4526_09085 [Nitrospiraceae bacterium]|nr:MAG: hypothetical protein C4526_09085 [Nitrospiraceae bacterium]
MKKTVCSLFVLFALCLADFAPAQEGGGTQAAESGIPADRGIVLIGKGKLLLVPELTYAHISANRLEITGFTVLPAIIIGVIQVEKIKRDVFIPSVTLKYGISDRAQFDLRIPYFIRKDEFITGAGPAMEKNTTDETAFGDIEGLLSLHAVREKESVPDVVATVKVKSRTGKAPYGLATKTIQSGAAQIPTELSTGSGHWAVEPGISLLKTVDPAVLFGSVSYFRHMKRSINGVGVVDPGDSVNYTLGMGYALNDRITLGTAFEQNFFSSAVIDGVKQVETDITVANLLFGVSYYMSGKKSLSFTLSIGLTPESPDLQVSLKMPVGIL